MKVCKYPYVYEVNVILISCTICTRLHCQAFPGRSASEER